MKIRKGATCFHGTASSSPQFVEALLERYADRKTRILDPFCGSGTVLSEAAGFGMAATGIEVNPAAYVLARTYSFCNVTPDVRKDTLNAVEDKLKSILPKRWAASRSYR